MKSKEYITLKKMIEYINKALRYTKDCNFESFSSNEEKVDANKDAWLEKFKNIVTGS